MTNEQLLAALAAAEAELTARPRDLTGIAVERVPDPNDQCAGISGMDVALHGINAHSDCLEQIRAARQRAKAGQGGICTDCDEPIAEKRLRALPWAERCTDCQARKEALEEPASSELADSTARGHVGYSDLPGGYPINPYERPGAHIVPTLADQMLMRDARRKKVGSSVGGAA